MSNDENNRLRLVAAEVIRTLWERGDRTQLELLQMQVQASLDRPHDPARSSEDEG